MDGFTVEVFQKLQTTRIQAHWMPSIGLKAFAFIGRS